MAGGCGTTGGWAVRSRALPGERAWLLPLGSADGRSDGMSVRSDRTGATSGGNGRSLLLGRLNRRGSTITTRPPPAFRAPPNWCALGLTSTWVRRCLVTLHLLAQPSTCTPCLLYTSDAADEEDSVDLGGRRIIKKKT